MGDSFDLALDELSMYCFVDKSLFKNIGVLVKFGSHIHTFEFGWWKTFTSVNTFMKHLQEGNLLESGMIYNQFDTKEEDVMTIKQVERMTLLMSCEAPKEEFDRIVNVLSHYQYGDFDILKNNSRHFVVKAVAVTKSFGYDVDESVLLNTVVGIANDQEIQKIYYLVSVIISTGFAAAIPVYNLLRFPLGLATLFTLVLGFDQMDPYIKSKLYDKYSHLFYQTCSFVEALRK